jgi:hypothetical protein
MEIEFTHCKNRFKKVRRFVAFEFAPVKQPQLAEFVMHARSFFGLAYFEGKPYFVVDDRAHALCDIEFTLDKGVFFNKVTYLIKGAQVTLQYFSLWNDVHADPMDPDGNDLFKSVFREWKNAKRKSQIA